MKMKNPRITILLTSYKYELKRLEGKFSRLNKTITNLLMDMERIVRKIEDVEEKIDELRKDKVRYVVH